MTRRNGQPVDKVEAAFIWAHNGKTYLFSDGEFWRFDESQKRERVNIQPEPGYPRDNSLWAGVPSHMDDIISWGEGNIQMHQCAMTFLTSVHGNAQYQWPQLIVALIFRRCLLLQGQPLLGAKKWRTEPRGCHCSVHCCGLVKMPCSACRPNCSGSSFPTEVQLRIKWGVFSRQTQLASPGLRCTDNVGAEQTPEYPAGYLLTLHQGNKGWLGDYIQHNPLAGCK